MHALCNGKCDLLCALAPSPCRLRSSARPEGHSQLCQAVRIWLRRQSFVGRMLRCTAAPLAWLSLYWQLAQAELHGRADGCRLGRQHPARPRRRSVCTCISLQSAMCIARRIAGNFKVKDLCIHVGSCIRLDLLALRAMTSGVPSPILLAVNEKRLRGWEAPKQSRKTAPAGGIGGKLSEPALRPSDSGPESVRGPISVASTPACAEIAATDARSRSLWLGLASGDSVSSRPGTCRGWRTVPFISGIWLRANLHAQGLTVHADGCSIVPSQRQRIYAVHACWRLLHYCSSGSTNEW